MVRRFARNKLALLGLCFILAVVTLALAAPYLTSHAPNKQDIMNRLEPPSHDHRFGTDELGRDVFSRLAWGARISLQVALLAVLGGASTGILLGLLSGFYGGIFDMVTMRIMDTLSAFPGVLLAILIMSTLGSGNREVILAVGIWLVPTYARIVRAEALRLRARDFVEAARAIGATDGRIMVKHVLLNSLSPIIVYATLSIPGAILTAASLSYLGLGIKPPTPEWGAMISAARSYMREAPTLILFPGMAIFITVLSFNFVGDALRDALDPKLKV
ncbi:MAG: diguanylate cyclase [Firmicutes bacterium]|nr:diguanylate cyclase [Bacillota bacterium]